MTNETTSLMLEFSANGKTWIATGEAPMPLSIHASSNDLPESVWRAYMDYLNAREITASEDSRRIFRLVRWHHIAKKDVL